jgi:hypothetical protein
MALSDLAQKIYDHLPSNGIKVGGITIQRDLELSKVEYGKGRDELKIEGLCVSGKGRGGSLARVEGKEPDNGKKTKGESLEIAREEKKARSRAQKELDEEVDIAYKWCKENLNYDVRKRSDVCLSYGAILVYVWDGPKAQAYQIPQLEVDKQRAAIRFAERRK